VFPLGYTITYTGGKPYIEYMIDGRKYGFARGDPKTNIPSIWIEEHVLGNNKQTVSPSWNVVSDDAEKKTEAMKEVVEATVQTAEEAPAAPKDLSTLSRAKLMALCKERGIDVSNKDKKADLLEKLA
jgi:hypothetical protein